MITLPNIKTNQPQLQETGYGLNSLGLVIPFQPSLVDLKTINAILNYALETVQEKLESKYKPEDIKTITEKLKNIFAKLNYNSHRKSVAIIINGEDEKIIYLNYSGKPVFFVDDPFSLLDLVGNSEKNPEFELLVLKNDGAELYEYFNNVLHKVFAQPQESDNKTGQNTEYLIQSVVNIIKLVNKNNDKPIFILSEDDQQTNKFFKFFPFGEIAFTINISATEDTGETTKLLAEKVNGQWNHWHCKLVRGQIAIAKRNQTLFAHLNSVIKALKQSDDGLLLIDSFMKEEIHKSLEDETLFNATQKLTNEIEKFLTRGNRIEIAQGGLLETLGGIALIKELNSHYQSYRFTRKYREEDFLV